MYKHLTFHKKMGNGEHHSLRQTYRKYGILTFTHGYVQEIAQSQGRPQKQVTIAKHISPSVKQRKLLNALKLH